MSALEVARGAGTVAAGDVIDLAVGEAVHGGWCVGRPVTDGAGPVVFIRHALPGELVRAKITQVTAQFARADAVGILRPSADRVAPPCSYAGPGGCGGCDWQHASLPAQRRIKGLVVAQQLRRIAGLDWQVTVEPLPGLESGPESGLGWRTRVRFAVGRDGAVGFYRHRAHEIVPVTECAIAHPLVNSAGVTGRRWPGARFVDVGVAPEAGQVAVQAGGRGSARAGGRGGARAGGRGGARGGGRGGARGGARRGDDGERGGEPAGRRFLTRQAAGQTWRVAADGFWQVHVAAADTLARAVVAALAPGPGETALDLYCGAGLFAGALAGATGPGGTVIGIEQDAAAVRDARSNLRRMPWARVHRGDAAEVLGRIGLGAAALAVLDPPRAGLSRELIAMLTAGNAEGAGGAAPGPASSGPGAAGLRGIAYVSCDPATLARDLAEFARHRWRLVELRAFDAFPMTHHVALLARLVPERA